MPRGDIHKLVFVCTGKQMFLITTNYLMAHGAVLAEHQPKISISHYKINLCCNTHLHEPRPSYTHPQPVTWHLRRQKESRDKFLFITLLPPISRLLVQLLPLPFKPYYTGTTRTGHQIKLRCFQSWHLKWNFTPNPEDALYRETHRAGLILWHHQGGSGGTAAKVFNVFLPNAWCFWNS